MSLARELSDRQRRIRRMGRWHLRSMRGGLRARLHPGVVGRAFGLAGLTLGALFVIWLVYFAPVQPFSVGTAVTGLIGLGLLLLASRYPDRSLLVLIVLLPFSGFILARLWAFGVPTSVVRHLAAWKEGLALGVVLAGFRGFMASGRRADALDRIALTFVGLAAVYLLIQSTIVPSAPSSMSVRLLGFRQDAGFVLVLLGARHAPLGRDFLDRAARAALFSAAIVAGVCVFESLASSTWNHFVVNTVRYTEYEVDVLGATPPNFYDIRVYGTIGGTEIVRAGSVFLSALTCGFYLVLGFALGLERTARGRRSPWSIPLLVLVGAGILLTQTRSAILAALIVALLAFQPAAGRTRHWRTQMGILLVGLVILAVPAALSTGLARRVAGASNNADNSSAAHVSAFWSGLRTVEHNPLGLGLGTSAGIGQRFAGSTSSGVVIPENTYLQLGIELGVAGALAFAALTIALVLQLRASARRRAHAVIAATSAAVAGLAVAAWFLQAWIDFSVAWTVWGMAGASLGAARAPALARVGELDLAPAAAVAGRPEQPVAA